MSFALPFSSQTLSSESAVRLYKDLSKVERAFRSLKTVDLKIRPIFHWLEARVRAHVFLCMLAYYVEWHMRQKLQPLLFDDEDKASAAALRSSIVAPAVRSQRAMRKDGSKRTDDGLPVHSFRTLLADLATLAKNRVRTSGAKGWRVLYADATHAAAATRIRTPRRLAVGRRQRLRGRSQRLAHPLRPAILNPSIIDLRGN